jgi:very-short-patch-repair endonuclease
MSSIFNKAASKKRRQYLRKNLPSAEKSLWRKLKKRQLMGLKFRRQHGVLTYVLDFYCPEYKLAIEIIGDVHGYSSRQKSDQIRREKIEALGIKMLFYTNGQINDELDGVLEDITSNLPPAPSFIRRGVHDRSLNLHL